jgi:serine/threonine-protein kinase
LDPLLWKRIGELFAAARLLSGESRIAFLKENCGQDQDLFEQVMSLLDVDGKPGPLDSHPTVSTLPIPQIIAGRFRIIRYIAEGGMGTVYEAEDLTLHDRVALKTIRPDIAAQPRAVERFKREISLGKKVTHSNVCRIHDLGVDRLENGAEFLFLTMQFLSGETLASRIKRGPIPKVEALPLIEDMTDALSAAHQAEVIHRDFKSGNVMLVSGAKRTCAVVTDFGLARGTRDNRSLHSGIVGTVDYMAPEQIRGEELTPAADIYALGIVMYEMVTGQRPFAGDSKVTVALKHLNDQPHPPRALAPHLDPNWNEGILGCLRKVPGERFQSAEEVKAFVQDGDKRHKYLKPKSRTMRHTWRRVLLALCALIAFGLATIGLADHYRHLPKPTSSVAVLPIVNRTGDSGLNYLSEGITTALTNDLSQVSGLTVTAESMAGRLAGKNLDPRSAGRDLGVQTVVSGSVVTEETRLRLQIELVDVNTGSLIWGQTYNRSQAELAALQEDVARELAYRLRIRLEGDVSERLRRQYRTNPAAYDAYLKGRYALRERSTSGFESALVYFQQAIDNDPQYAPAFAGMADSYCLMAYNRIQPTVTLLDKCKDAANRALQIDSTLAEAYTSLAGAVILLDFNWTAAEGMYRRSIQLDPNYLPAHIWYSLLLTALGRPSEAMAQIQYVLHADPDALMTRVTLSLVDYSAGDYDAAISELERVKQHSPSFARADEVLVEVYLAKNMPAEVLRIVTESSPPTQESREVLAIARGMAYARMGHKTLALKQLTEAEAALKHGYLLNYQVAALCTAVGYRQKALGYLQKALSARQTSIIYVNVDPLMVPLRSDERFHQLLSTLHLI